MTATNPLDLARQLAARDLLAAYFTILSPARTPGVPPHLVHRHLALLLIVYASRGRLPYRMIDREFDRWASRHLVQADVFHAPQGIGRRHRLLAKRRFGALAVCEALTSHVRNQQELVTAEHAKCGAAPVHWDENHIASIEEEYAESDLILTASRFSYNSFAARGVPASKLAVVPYGVDCDAFQPMPRTDSVFRILYVGTLSIRKGLHYLLEAVARLKWPDAELRLQGGMTAETAALLADYDGSIPLVVVPPRPRSRLLYSGGSVLVLPSIEDGFGLVIGQALACGIPVIATTHSGGPDAIEDGVTGFVVPPGDADALRGALTTAYENRERLADMGLEARRRAERARGWDTYGDGVVAAFARALDARSTDGRREAI